MGLLSVNDNNVLKPTLTCGNENKYQTFLTPLLFLRQESFIVWEYFSGNICYINRNKLSILN